MAATTREKGSPWTSERRAWETRGAVGKEKREEEEEKEKEKKKAWKLANSNLKQIRGCILTYQ